MEHRSRTKMILNDDNLRAIASLIKSKSEGFNEPRIYLTNIGSKNQEGEISEKQKGSVSAYLWDKRVNRGSMSVNIAVINGYQDPLFNGEDKVQIYYEIFPSASHNPHNSAIFKTFRKEQNTIKANNFSETKSAISRIFAKVHNRR